MLEPFFLLSTSFQYVRVENFFRGIYFRIAVIDRNTRFFLSSNCRSVREFVFFLFLDRFVVRFPPLLGVIWVSQIVFPYQKVRVLSGLCSVGQSTSSAQLESENPIERILNTYRLQALTAKNGHFFLKV